jgi:GR25 family glycosyltransferase involved in LPS biosynthesis
MFNLVGITCYRLVERFTTFMNQYHTSMSNTFKKPKLILGCDANSDLVFSMSDYRPALWDKHLQHSRAIHDYNVFIGQQGSIRSCSSKERLARYCNFIETNQQVNMYCPRHLSGSEHSLLQKHYQALLYASNQQAPTLVLEDDALLKVSSTDSLGLEQAMRSLCEEVGFINLSKTYLSDSYYSEYQFRRHRVARTDTTCAYAITPRLARCLIESFYPYSLPIDFHLQYLFCRLSKSGYSTPSIFINGSLVGECKSTVCKNV